MFAIDIKNKLSNTGNAVQRFSIKASLQNTNAFVETKTHKSNFMVCEVKGVQTHNTCF